LCHYVEGSLIPKGSDTLRASYNFMLIDDISLVRDTTQPMISLDKFSLGNDTTLCNGDTMRIGGEPHFFSATIGTPEIRLALSTSTSPALIGALPILVAIPLQIRLW